MSKDTPIHSTLIQGVAKHWHFVFSSELLLTFGKWLGDPKKKEEVPLDWAEYDPDAENLAEDEVLQNIQVLEDTHNMPGLEFNLGHFQPHSNILQLHSNIVS